MTIEGVGAANQYLGPRPGELDEQAMAARGVIYAAQSRFEGPDVGYFPEGSALRLVQSSRLVGLLYGQLGLAIGGTDPLNYIGTSEHTRDRELPFRRLSETAQAFETIFFGSREKADQVINRVTRMHNGVKGEMAEAAGPNPKGTPYSAYDPDRQLWTLACMAYPAVSLYEELEEPLSDLGREAFWQDYLLVGELFGLPRDKAPQTYQGFRDYMQGRFKSGELHLTNAAKYMGKEICFNVPIPHCPAFVRKGMNALLLGMLPPEIRDLYGLSYRQRQEDDFRRAASAVRLGKSPLPKSVINGSNTYFFNQVIREEARLQTLGEQAAMPANAY